MVWTAIPAKADSYCEFSGRIVLIVLDQTTQYDELDRELLHDGLGAIVDRLEAGDRVIVHTITDEWTRSNKLFDDCHPGCARRGVLDWMTCSEVLTKQRSRAFREKLAAALRAIMQNLIEYSRSAITETLVSLTSIYRDEGLEQLVVFGDLIENSDTLPWPAILKENGTEQQHAGLNPDVSGVSIRVFGFGRFHDDVRRSLLPHEGKGVIEFWDSFFRSGGATSVKVGQRW